MITLDYTLTRAHLLAFQKLIPQRLIEAGGPSYRRNRWILWFTLAFVAGTGTALLEHIIGHPPDELSSTAALLFGVGAMVALMAQRSRVLRAVWLRDGGPTLAPHHTEVDASGLRLSSPNLDSICRWPAVRDVSQHEDVLVVWIEAFNGFIIPRAAFADAIAEQAFLNFSREQIAANGASAAAQLKA